MKVSRPGLAKTADPAPDSGLAGDDPAPPPRKRKAAPVPDLPFHYRRVSPREHPPQEVPDLSSLLGYVATPLLGSRLAFPRLFGQALRRGLADPGAADFPPHLARWYFGRALSFEIDPGRLTHRISDFVKDHRGFRWVGRSFLDAADWSAALAPLDRSPVHREMRGLVDAELDFRQLHTYRVQVQAAAAGRPVRRNGVTLATIEQVDAYYRYCVEVAESMRRHGALPRQDLGRRGHRILQHRSVRPPTMDRVERDVGVAIDAGGRLVRHLGGKHRTALAQALGLQRLPVEVRLVHVDWLAGQVRQSGQPPHVALVSALQRHPDLLPARQT